MKKTTAVAIALSLAGCATVQPTADSALMRAEQSLIVAHNGFQGAEAVAAPLIRHRVLTAAEVGTVADIADKAERLFIGADTTLGVAERAAEINKLTAQLKSLVKGR